MTNTDKLLLYVLEIARADQVAWLLETSQTKGRPLDVMVVEAVRTMMNSLPLAERREIIAQFKEEDGIDLKEFL